MVLTLHAQIKICKCLELSQESEWKQSWKTRSRVVDLGGTWVAVEAIVINGLEIAQILGVNLSRKLDGH